jgi:hypothetical protein
LMGQRRCLGSSLAEFVQPRLDQVNFPGIFMGHKEIAAPRSEPEPGLVCAVRQASVGLCRKLEKRILRLHKNGMGALRIGKTLGVGTGLVQGVVSPFEASAA